MLPFLVPFGIVVLVVFVILLAVYLVGHGVAKANYTADLTLEPLKPNEAPHLDWSSISALTDELAARGNPHNFMNRALVDDWYDFNKDSLVNATDELIVRGFNTNFMTALQQWTAP